MVRNAALRTAAVLLTVGAFWASPVVVYTQEEGGGTPKPKGTFFNAGAQLTSMPQPAQGIAVRAGRLFDPRTGTNLVNQVIIIKGDRITDVGPADRVQIPAGARVIDLSRATVLPGLINRHLHLFNSAPAPGQDNENEFQRALRGWNLAMRDMTGGFSTVQDMGSGTTYGAVDMRNAITQGWIPGPRMQVAGPHLLPGHGSAKPAPSVPSPFGYGVGQPLWQDVGNVNSPWLARAAVRERHYYGVDWIKIYSTNDFSGSGYVGNRGIFRPDGTMNLYPVMTLEETQAAVDEAHRNGLKVTCHAYGGEGLKNCIESGVDIPMHLAVGVTGAEGLDEETIRLLKVPLNGKQRPVMQTLWDLVGNMEVGDMRSSSEKKTRFSLTEKSFKRIVAAGIPEPFGSGATQGYQGHGTQTMQFPIYVKWGMTPAQALQTATSVAAASLNYDLGDFVGYVEKGRFADLSAVSGDPLQDISEMMRIKFVMKGGTIYRDELSPGGVPIEMMTGVPSPGAVGR